MLRCMPETKPARGYKPGTTFIYFGVLLGAWGVFAQTILLLIVGVILVIVGVAKKVERPSPPPF
jgi:uncharacterized membrane protein HdeD (DUF308 family)